MRGGTQSFDPRQTMHLPGFEVFHYRDASPACVRLHHHDYYEIYFLIDGKMEYLVEGRSYHLEPGDLLLINPMELHQPVTVSDDEVFDRIVLWVDQQFMDSHASPTCSLTHCFSNTPAHTNLLRPSPAQRADITLRLEGLLRERYDQDYGSEQCGEGMLLQFLVELNRLALQEEKNHANERGSASPIQQVLAYVSEHYSEDLSLESLAQRFYISKYYLAHAFKKISGTSLHQYILLKRLLIAKQMISDGIPAGTAASNCGFSDYSSFYRAFQAQYGISPRECFPRRES